MPRISRLTAAQRTAHARLAAYASHAAYPTGERTAHLQGRSPQHLAYWERRVRAEHPDLDEADIARRAHLYYRQHMTRLAFRASKARTARRQADK